MAAVVVAECWNRIRKTFSCVGYANALGKKIVRFLKKMRRKTAARAA
jgi:hypothetical protein